MKSLSEIRKKKTAVFTFGRMNPPTRGHQKLIDKVLEEAQKRGADPFVYVSSSHDPNKNPLTNQQKIKYLKLGLPEAVSAIKEEPKIRTPFEALSSLIDRGYTNITLVVGADQVAAFEKAIRPYINHPDKHKTINVDSFEVISAGERQPEDARDMSGTKMRAAALKNDYVSFRLGVSLGLSDRFAREMFDLVRRGMKIAEEILATRSRHDIPRNKMPQIAAADIILFMQELQKDGVAISKESVSINTLKPTQSEINTITVNKKAEGFANGSTPKPFIVSVDNFILDGHHQLYALKSLDKSQKVVSYVVGLTMDELLKYAQDFSKVSYKDIDE